MIIVESNEDIKTVEVGCLTFDKDKTLNSIIFRGLGKALDPMEVNKKPGIPFHKDTIKEEPKEPADNQDPNPTGLPIDIESVQEREIDKNQMNISDDMQEKNIRLSCTKDIENKKDEGLRLMNRMLKVTLVRLEVDEHGEVKWMKDLLEKLKSSNDGYDSDDTVIYHPGRVIKSKSLKVQYEECGTA